MTNFQSFINKSLTKASEIAKEYFGKVEGTVKSDDNNQVLTQADLEIGRFLIQQIEETCPSHNIIDEEAGVIDKKSDYIWTIDPIDGTSNFVNGLPHYGILLGVVYIDKPIAGGVILPFFNEFYYGEKDKGAFCNDAPIKVATETNLLNLLIAYGIDGHQENPEFTRKEGKLLSEIVLSVRNIRSSNSVFDMMMTANGKYGAYLNQTSKIWDNVPTQIILEEAGAVYTDFFGKKIDYSNIIKRAGDDIIMTCCAGAPEIHKKLQEIIHK